MRYVYAGINLKDKAVYAVEKDDCYKTKFSYYINPVYWNVPQNLLDYMFDLGMHEHPYDLINMSQYPTLRNYNTTDSYDQMFIETVRNPGFIYDVYKFLGNFRFDYYNYTFYCTETSSKNSLFGIKTSFQKGMNNGFIESEEILVVNQWNTTNNFSAFRKGFYDAYCKLLNNTKIKFYVPLNLNTVIQEEEIEDYVNANTKLCKKAKDPVEKFIYRTNLHLMQYTLKLEG